MHIITEQLTKGVVNRGGRTGGAIAPPTFGILLNIHNLAPPTVLTRSVYNSTTNFSYLPPPLNYH